MVPHFPPPLPSHLASTCVLTEIVCVSPAVQTNWREKLNARMLLSAAKRQVGRSPASHRMCLHNVRNMLLLTPLHSDLASGQAGQVQRYSSDLYISNCMALAYHVLAHCSDQPAQPQPRGHGVSTLLLRCITCLMLSAMC
jgi:hypothetical protein